MSPTHTSSPSMAPGQVHAAARRGLAGPPGRGRPCSSVDIKGLQAGEGAAATHTMKPAGALLLLCAALLLTSGGDCNICSSVEHDVTLFITGTPDEYVQQVAQYQNDSAILENARSLKECVDAKFTEEDKMNTISVLVGPALCVRLPGAYLGVCSGWRGAPSFLLHHGPSLGIQKEKSFMNGEAERMVWERVSPALGLSGPPWLLSAAQPPVRELAGPPVSLALPGLGVRPSGLASLTPVSPACEPGPLNC
ncbi:uncharacterized protein LOC123930524 [Meles meles]|uniref:uncharacterized protein LOC123930524 n=1 Tax=Meles meles TaxID=9662 RepID=UPI001E69BD43|nr:uncharacterized protein LOC123930524 [Meles meles]